MRTPLPVLALALAALPAVASATEKIPLRHAQGAPPAIVPGTGPAYHLWQDEAGWHLRWVGKPAVDGKKPAFTGIISVPSARISLIKPAGMTGGDDTLNRLDGTRAMFKSECTDAVEGLDFKLPDNATSLYLELFVDYDVISPSIVHIGKDAITPTDISPMLQIDVTPPPKP